MAQSSGREGTEGTISFPHFTRESDYQVACFATSLTPARTEKLLYPRPLSLKLSRWMALEITARRITLGVGWGKLPVS